ncbi:MAG: LamG-like jellyroll fold domain-containing protein [bacterium]
MQTLKVLSAVVFFLMLSIICISFSISQITSEDENIRQELTKLPKGTYGYIVWASNREGNWNIYRMDIPSGKTIKITQNDDDNNDVCISYDGKFIAWSRGDKYKSDVWIMKADGTDQHLIVSNAFMGTWRSDGSIIVYRGKDHDSSFVYNPKTKTETKIWPLDNVKVGTKDVREATPSPDNKMIIAWASKPRGTWLFSSDGSFQKHVHSGCEGRFAPDGSFIYWVMEPGKFGRANLKGEIQQPLYVSEDIYYGHTYFPKLSKNMDYLVFGACPNDQHDHDTSDYEIFIMKMDELKPAWEKPIRLTYDPATDRFPDIFMDVDKTPPDTPQGLKIELQGQAVKLFWKGSHDPESGIIGYNVCRSNDKKNFELIAKEVKDTFYVDYKTNPRIKYQYCVSAINFADLESPKSKSMSISVKDLKPIAPKNIYVSAKGNGLGVSLRWESNPELDIKGYNIYRSIENSDRYSKINKKIILDTKYIDSSVEMGKTYNYCVTAVDTSNKEGKRSEPISWTVRQRVSKGLLAFYLFDEGQGSVVYDHSELQPPINLLIKDNNRVRWIKNSGAIEFVRSSIVSSDGNADKIFNNLKGRNELSIEVWLSPANLTQTGPARIVSMSKDPIQRNFTLGQIGKDLAIRLRTTTTDQNGIPELDTNKHVLSQQPIHIMTTFDGKTKKLYINGNLYSESQQLNGDFSNWTNYPLILGNEYTGDRTWLGKIYLLAIYNRSLSSDEILNNYQSGF